MRIKCLAQGQYCRCQQIRTMDLTIESPLSHAKLLNARYDNNPGADPGFSNRGGAKDYMHASHITSVNPEVLYGRAPGSSRVLDALSCYLCHILKHSDSKTGFKKHSRSKFRGGAHLLTAPLWIRHSNLSCMARSDHCHVDHRMVQTWSQFEFFHILNIQKNFVWTVTY